MPAEPTHISATHSLCDRIFIPDPRSLAVADSFLKSFAADWATASTTCGAMMGVELYGGKVKEISSCRLYKREVLMIGVVFAASNNPYGLRSKM